MSDDVAGRGPGKYREDRPWQDLDTMLSVDEARERILAAVEPCDAQPVALLQCHGLVLAEDVYAQEPVPPFRNSAMDGYAVRASDVAEASYDSPAILQVVANLPAGKSPERSVGRREAIRIMTGAVIPDGADTVVRFEETSEVLGSGQADTQHGGTVEVLNPQHIGANVREAGEDIQAGSHVFSPGANIDSATLGILASVNKSEVLAFPRPVVGILATGDEVVDPGEAINRGQIRNSNNFTIAGLVREAGGVPEVIGVASDSEQELRSRLAEARKYDLLVTSGGVSLGDYDVVKDVLQAEGHIDLWQVRIKPGKPMAFGSMSGVPLIGLPGNPVAAYVAFLQFAVPAIRKMRGLKDAPYKAVRARLVCEHENRGHRRHFVRGVWRIQDGERVVEPVPVQGSGVLSSVARANCLFIIPEDLNHAPAGLEVDVIVLDRDY